MKLGLINSAFQQVGMDHILTEYGIPRCARHFVNATT
jgi:hypothetical protein